ncbi:putative bifunctional diguanylate cyclase/phosphodiesterase [Oricola cellulosilytica]|uniref:EAL domain-containing protein n=1 Tax=Oricola cellulosilytica TaxID=1429082 RepID=A0A4R0PFA2_9HYPH|nr:EAL domain-containing protein [Oricola cellulosilytica]TCD15473.1 EAL domain-containing protein [Oricola cellulosilytica]
MSFQINSKKQDEIASLAKRLTMDGAGGDPYSAEVRELIGEPDRTGLPIRLRDARTSGAIAMTDEMKGHLARSYQPISRAVLAAAAFYFALITVAHYFDENFVGFLLLGSISVITSIACLSMYLEFRRRELAYEELELRALIVFGLIHGSLVAHHILHLEPPKLIYFTFLALVIATVSISARTAAVAVLIPLFTMLSFAYQAGPETLRQHIFIGIAGTLVAYCMAKLTGTAIRREIQARIVADQLRNSSESLADADMLTGLPNRRHFFRELKSYLKRSRRAGNGFALAIIDLDGFKPVNDKFGHAVGDKLLFEVGRRLAVAGGQSCFAARLGGDEFAVLVENAPEVGDLEGLGQHLRHAISQPYEIIGIQISISASVGFALEQATILTESDLIERADYALYQAKETQSGVVIYSDEHETARRDSAAVEHCLRHCDADREMYVLYQPQVDILSGKTVGFEALARWNSPELGEIRPDVFIAAAERTGRIVEMTPILLRKALAAAAAWDGDFKLSFNLSTRDIDSSAAIDNICQIVSASGYPAHMVEFEVTETLVMADFAQAKSSLAKLSALGARIALDDFGVGYTNFDYIDRLCVDTIKIDRTFVRRLDERGSAEKVIRAMIDMCAKLRIDIVVEGVETERQLAFLRAAGARCIQGYYFSVPMKAAEIPAYLVRGHASAPKENAEFSLMAG